MKKLLLFLILPFVVGCGSGIVDVASSGKPYEVFVLASKPIWDGAVGDSIRSTFSQEVEWLNQPEPLFDILNITPEGLNDNIRRHRNLLVVTVDEKLDSSSFTAKENEWASNQQVMNLSGPSVKSLTDYWVANGQVIVDWLSIVERGRMQSRAAKYNDANLDKLVFEKVGLKINIPKGYKVSANTDNFLWLGSDIPLGTLGIVFYTFEGSEDSFDFLKQRNIAMAKVPGPSKGSYMTTDTIFMPDAYPMELDGVSWLRVKGFWKVENDFMGGPFVSYVTYDKAKGRYIGVDMFVNSPSPKYPKRNYVRQFEAIIMNAKL